MRYAEWRRCFLRYLVAASLLVGASLAVGLPVLWEEGQRGLILAAGIALPVQLLSFGALAARSPASAGFMAVWGAGTLARFAVLGAAAFVIVGMERVDVVVALLSLAGLFFVLLLMEPWALRGRESETS